MDNAPEITDGLIGRPPTITDLAQKRLETAQADISKERPEFLLSVDRTEVMYTLPPRMLPLAQVQWNELREAIDGLFNTTSVDQDFSPLLSGGGSSPESLASLSHDQLVQLLLRQTPTLVGFKSGRFPTGAARASAKREEYVPIGSIRITTEAIAVNVGGPTSVGEAVAALAFEAIWRSSGYAMTWEEVASEVQLVGYASATRVDLGCNANWLLSHGLRQFLSENVVDGGELFAAHMGDYSTKHDLKPPPNSALIYAFERLILKFFRFDLDTGRKSETDVRFEVMSKGDYNTGHLMVVSELPLEEHLRFVGGLVDALKEE